MASVWVFAKPPAGSSGQDALGLITIYPRPDEPISDPLQPYQPQPLFSHHLSIRPLSQIQRHSQPISIHDHHTILNQRSQHIRKNNRITVYPFIYKRVNHYNTTEKSLLKFILLNHSQHKMNVGPENVPVRHSFCVCPELLLATNIWRSYLQSPTAICDHFAP